jgi:opacity protein-like surface antigen
MGIKKKLLKPLLISCMLPLAAVSHAEDKMNFVTFKAGIIQPNSLGGNAHLDSSKAAYTSGLEVGRKFMDIYAVSLEVRADEETKFESNTPTGDKYNQAAWNVSSTMVMLNFSADLLKQSMLTPYVKVGIGASRNNASDYSINDVNAKNPANPVRYPGKTNTSLAWQVGAGLRMATTQMFDTELAYMYTSKGKAKTKNEFYNGNSAPITSDAKYGKLEEHVFTIGVRFKF